MAQITPIDKLFITISQNGNLHHITELSGVSSLADIVNCMRSRFPGLKGLATIGVRNTTCGWTASRPVFLR